MRYLCIVSRDERQLYEYSRPCVRACVLVSCEDAGASVGDRLVVGRQVLALVAGVRILLPQPVFVLPSPPTFGSPDGPIV
jgi:hypothetical protein